MEEYNANRLNGIFDSHCHYDDGAFDNDRSELLSGMLSSGKVKYLLHASVDAASSEFGIRYSESFDSFYTSIGFHPENIGSIPEDYLLILEKLAKHKKVIAVGEIGLDYHYDNGESREKQLELFEAQVAFANSHDLPIIIHCRDALEDVMEVVKKYRPRGVVHCFSGSAETALEFVRLGMYIGFTGVLSFKNAKKVKKAFLAVPHDKFLFETDCPYMSPEPFRGKRCDSRLIAYTALEAQRLSGIDAQELINIAAENTARLFGVSL